MLPGKKYSGEEIARILRRRKWLVLLPFALGLAGIPSIIIGLFARYRSDALIMVVPQAIGGLVLGLALVVLLEYRDSSFSYEQDVQRTLTLPVLGTIPLMLSEREQQLRRRRRLAIGVAGILVGSAVVLVVWTLRL